MVNPGDWENDPTLFLRWSAGLSAPEVIQTNGKDPYQDLTYYDLALPMFFTSFPDDYQFLAKDNSATPGGWSQAKYYGLIGVIAPVGYIVNRNGVVLEENPNNPPLPAGLINSTTTFRYVFTLNMEFHGFPKPVVVPPPIIPIIPPIIPPTITKEPWMNNYSSNGNWVPVSQLRWQPYTGMDPKTVGKSNEYCADQPTTNVSSNYFLRPLQNGYTWPQIIVRPSDLNPNPDKARFDRNVWVIISNFGGQYVGTYP